VALSNALGARMCRGTFFLTQNIFRKKLLSEFEKILSEIFLMKYGRFCQRVVE